MRIRVATLNVWALPEPFAKDVSARMQAIARRLPSLQVDVMAFQEVWTPEARRALLAAGRESGLEHSWYKEAVLGGSGLLVLSRLPMESVHFERFALRGYPQRPDHGDYYGGKGFASLRLRTDAGPLRFIDTHLHARYDRDVSHSYRPHRVGQIVQLAIATRELAEPVVAVGDFNLSEGQPEYAVLTGLTRLRDVAAELERRQATVLDGSPYRTSRGGPGRRIDYVLARDGTRLGVRPRSIERIFDGVFERDGRRITYSNHTGILSDLELHPRVTAPARAPAPPAIELASRLLSEGRDEAERRQRSYRAWSGVGMGCAVLTSFGTRGFDLTRRKLLRLSLQGASLIALTPGVGMSLLSELFVPDEIRAFDALATRLTEFAPEALDESIA